MIQIAIDKKINRYDGSTLLHVERTFSQGAITWVKGPSGSGKTTFLRILAGLTRPDNGEVVVFGKTWVNIVEEIYVTPQLRSTGFVFQDYALFPHLTVFEHLRFGTADSNYIEQLLDLLWLKDFQYCMPGKLSGGQRQRLAIARALTNRPQLLLMDEPFSALDGQLKKELIEGLKPLLEENQISCITVSHDDLNSLGFATDIFIID